MTTTQDQLPRDRRRAARDRIAEAERTAERLLAERREALRRDLELRRAAATQPRALRVVG